MAIQLHACWLVCNMGVLKVWADEDYHQNQCAHPQPTQWWGLMLVGVQCKDQSQTDCAKHHSQPEPMIRWKLCGEFGCMGMHHMEEAAASKPLKQGEILYWQALCSQIAHNRAD